MVGYRWLLMDADNTLFDFSSAEEAALRLTMERFGWPFSPAALECYRAANDLLWSAFDRGEVSQDQLTVERFARFFSEQRRDGDPVAWNRCYCEQVARRSDLLPGAEQVCQTLSARFVLALCTNGLSDVQRRRLAPSPLAPYFGDRVFISGEMGLKKPDPAYFDAVLNALGAQNDRNRCLVVGDSLGSDIAGARGTGLDCVWLRPEGRGAGELVPTYEISAITELPALLDAVSPG